MCAQYQPDNPDQSPRSPANRDAALAYARMGRAVVPNYPVADGVAELPPAWRKLLKTRSLSDKQSRGPTKQRLASPPMAATLESGESHGEGGGS